MRNSPENVEVTSSDISKVPHIEKIPNIEKHIDDNGKNPKNGDCSKPSDHIKIPSVPGEISYSLVSSDGINNRIKFVFGRNTTKYLENIVSQDIYPYYQRLDLKIKETKFQEIYDRIKTISNIILIQENMVVSKIDNIFIVFSLHGSSLCGYMDFEIHSTTLEDFNITSKKLETLFKDLSSTEERYIYLSWYYNTPDGYRYITINDKLYDTFYEEAYPYLDIENIANDYMKRDEPIMVLLGPPGTGKTRLIRYILNSFCNQRNKNINVMVTSDQTIIEQGNLFINFIGSDDQDVLVLEDIDYHLTARKDGNTAMYNFLSISNGLAIGHQRDKKIILSTNLPNVTNIDQALLRPGRCFGILETRLLYYDESVALLKKLKIPGELNPKKEYSLAELYNYGKKSGEILTKKKSTGFL